MVSSSKQRVRKPMRRSVLNSGRRSFDTTEESNNYQLAEALAKCRVAYGKMEQEKFRYVSQNLKLVDANIFLKNEVAELKNGQELLQQENAHLKSVLMTIQRDIIQVKKTGFVDKHLKLLSKALKGQHSTTFTSPPSLTSSFDSGLNSSSDSTDKQAVDNIKLPDSANTSDSTNTSDSRMFVEENPCPAKPSNKQKHSATKNTSDSNIFAAEVPTPPAVTSSIFAAANNDNGSSPAVNVVRSPLTELVTTPRVGDARAPKRCALLNKPEPTYQLFTPKVVKRDESLVQKRVTPSRSTKTRITTFAEPALNSKLRRGDKHTDNFSMEYIAKKK